MMRQILVTGLVLVGLLTAVVSWAVPDIRVQGLFGGSAVLVINGKQRLLKQGQTSPEGVTLVASDSHQAVVEIEGRRVTLGLSQHISSSFQAAKLAEVRIPRASNGHYMVSGSINGHPVDFMVDTGATSVAMSLNDAKRLGVDFRRGKRASASTAGGIVNAFEVDLDKLVIGNITAHQVSATIVVGDYPTDVLLGNSFLSRVEMTEEEGVMVLRKKY
jgi:aspartyl protease family protein|tara:strand:+ start:9607 stop:10257 length:651 start_codon:yes stop_codon:yes gene_type:complete